MQYSPLIQAIKKEIGFEPKQSDLCKILDIGRGTMSNRAKNDSKFSDDEIKKIEEFYAIKLDRDVSNISVELEYYPDVFGSCGTGCMVFSEAKEKLAVTKDIITNYSASNQYSIISARGSSMSPTINDDDKLVIQHNLNEQIIDDTVYLFRYNDELFIKRLVKNVDQIVCISENPRFQDRIIEPKGDNFSIIGKVVGLFRSKV
jgi:phage repressor protein C with HTH and peptisase S24 domain